MSYGSTQGKIRYIERLVHPLLKHGNCRPVHNYHTLAEMRYGELLISVLCSNSSLHISQSKDLRRKGSGSRLFLPNATHFRTCLLYSCISSFCAKSPCSGCQIPSSALQTFSTQEEEAQTVQQVAVVSALPREECTGQHHIYK